MIYSYIVVDVEGKVLKSFDLFTEEYGIDRKKAKHDAIEYAKNSNKFCVTVYKCEKDKFLPTQTQVWPAKRNSNKEEN